MGNLRQAYITEARVYDDPKHTETSPYDVALFMTVPEAVVDPQTGQSMAEIISDLSESIEAVSDMPRASSTQDGLMSSTDKVKIDRIMPSAAMPLMDGTAAPGTDNGKYAREGHVHPPDTSKADASSTVTLTTVQTVSGVKTFSALPVSSVTPTGATQLTPKSYVDTQIALKADRSTLAPTAFSIPASAWAADTTYANYGFRAKLTISGVVAADRVDVVFDPASIASAMDAEVMPANTAIAAGVYLYAKTAPTAALTGNYIVYKAV